mgnify:CR=1 FL=1
MEKRRAFSMTTRTDAQAWYIRLMTAKISTSCVFGEVGKAQAPDVIYQIKVNDAVKISYTFDTLCRVTRKTIHLKDKTYPVDYTFVPGRKAGITTLLLKEINNNGKKLSLCL